MSTTAVAATAGWLASVVFGLGAMVLRVARPDPIVANIFGLGAAGMVAFVILGIAWSSVGALLMVRRPGNLVGWVMLAVGVGYSTSILGAAVTSMAVADGPASRDLAGVAGWITGFGTLVGSGVFYLAIIFPTGHGHTPNWDRIGRLLMANAILFSAALLTQPGSLHLWPSIDNPFGFGPDMRPLFAGRLASMIAIGVGVFIPFLAVALVSRYRAANAIERVQLRWFVASIVLTLSSLVVVAIVGVSDPGVIGELPLVACGIAGTTVPLAIGIAVLRYRLYEIDRIISRTVSWALVTAVLVAVFAGAIVAFQAVLSSVTQGQTLAVAASTLVAFALFQPLRRRVQAAVDRRFDRSSYDAELTVDRFGARLRSEVDLAAIRSDVSGTVVGAVRPLHAGLWIRGGGS